MSVFSPLALTQALPFLPLAQGDIDYEVSRRDEPDLFDTALLEPATKVILVKDGMVAVPRGQGAIADYANVHMRLAQLPGAYVAAELHTHPTALAIFLGSYGGKRDEHVVAVDVSRVKAAETVAASSEHMARTMRSANSTNRKRKRRNRCWKALRNDSTGSICADSHRMPARAKQARPRRRSRWAYGMRANVIAPHAALRPNRRWGDGRNAAPAKRTASDCCSPEWNRPSSRRSWTMRTVCCCNTTAHGATPDCTPYRPLRGSRRKPGACLPA